ncbi:hypothetical protein SASPL_152255 [Salvia splendens]|uniref:protein-serine/threonine phosphatase n=2 Tax=Salvia splendens TaxID=180675 RepID=A0A8X8Z0P7_SALSN|nr:probable protein phosphatase 2C 28 isoform X1 [Salvia splendens]KAG6387073.1 hypothetical protein SASPL_152255 [Salvia splendens]
MDGPDIVSVKRERSVSNSEAGVIKIKRSQTPDDIMSAILKEENRKRAKQHVSHGCHLVEGKMKHGMEDCLVATCKKIDGHDLGLYAIFDGHSGRDVAQYLHDHLFHNILNQADFWRSPKEAVRRAYEETDKDILENVVGSRGGSTAVTAIVIDGEKVVVANVGDSRAVVCRNGEAKQVSVDHEALKERKMVESKGGFVSHKPGNVPRVDGQLAMTRAFGDGRLKAHITSRPDIAIEMIDEQTEFIVLASDGVWHVMSNEEAVDCIRGMKDGGEAAKELINQALSRGSKDDISCVVVLFQD